MMAALAGQLGTHVDVGFRQARQPALQGAELQTGASDQQRNAAGLGDAVHRSLRIDTEISR